VKKVLNKGKLIPQPFGTVSKCLIINLGSKNAISVQNKYSNSFAKWLDFIMHLPGQIFAQGFKYAP
jgi:hypothetical protein